MADRVVVIAPAGENNFLGTITGSPIPSRGDTKEKVIGRLVKRCPRLFGLDAKSFNLNRPSEEIGAVVLANERAFGITIQEQKEVP